MADAVGAEHAFFSTCGSSLSVKAAMLAVAGHDGHLILSRDVHKSVVAGLAFSDDCRAGSRMSRSMTGPPSSALLGLLLLLKRGFAGLAGRPVTDWILPRS